MRRLLPIACIAVGVWLLVVAVVYTSWLGLAVGLSAVAFGVADLRR